MITVKDPRVVKLKRQLEDERRQLEYIDKMKEKEEREILMKEHKILMNMLGVERDDGHSEVFDSILTCRCKERNRQTENKVKQSEYLDKVKEKEEHKILMKEHGVSMKDERSEVFDSILTCRCKERKSN